MNILRLSAAAAVIGAGLFAVSPAFAWGEGPGYGYRRGPVYDYDYGPPRVAPRPFWRRWHHRRGWDGPPPGFYRRGW